MSEYLTEWEDRSISSMHSQTNRIQQHDSVSEALTRLINKNPNFRYGSAANHDSSPSLEDFQYPPIFTRHNWNVFKKKYNSSSWNDLIRITTSRIIIIGRNTYRKIAWQSVGILGITALLISTLICHLIIKYTMKLLWWLLSLSSLLLVDWHELQQASVPNVIVQLYHQLQGILQWVDQSILQARRFIGREWNTESFVWENGSIPESRTCSLWQLPPPSIKQGRKTALSREQMARDKWSDSTLDHIIAIDYCYIMLREESLRKIASKQRRLLQEETNGWTASEVATQSARRRAVSESALYFDTMEATETTHLDSGDVITVISTNDSGSLHKNSENVDEMTEAIELKVTDRNTLQNIKSTESERLIQDSTLGTFADEEQDDISLASDVAADMPWIDVGTKIGLRLLNSAHVQRAITSQDNRTAALSKKPDHAIMQSMTGYAQLDSSRSREIPSPFDIQTPPRNVAKPIHSMWTSPAAAAVTIKYGSCQDHDSFANEQSSQYYRNLSTITTADSPSPEKNHRSYSSYDEPGVTEHHEMAILFPHPPLTANRDTRENLRLLHLVRSQNSLSGHTIREPSIDSDVSKFRSCIKRSPLATGVKVIVPLFPLQPYNRSFKNVTHLQFQMGTVVSSKRTYVGDVKSASSEETNCLSVTLKLDKSFLRNGEFAEMTFRVMDLWPQKYMPKHSKVPIGCCVATSFGIGILVGWRVEDDCHVIRSLWQKRGPGAAHAYLNRGSIHGIVEAATGFEVETQYGPGLVLAYSFGGRDFLEGQFLVKFEENIRHVSRVVEMNRIDILECLGPQFVPVLEYIREAAHYQIQLDNYEAALREKRLALDNELEPSLEQKIWESWSECADILWKSFLKAVDEDKEFDQEINEFMTSIITFLERIDGGRPNENDHPATETTDSINDVQGSATNKEPSGLWVMDDFFGGVLRSASTEVNDYESSSACDRNTDTNPADIEKRRQRNFERVFAVLRVLMNTVSMARASSNHHYHFRMGLAILYDFLLFVRTLVKVQKKNMSAHSIQIWQRAMAEIATTFGPIQDRLKKIGQGIAERMERHGRKAKVRLLKFVDFILNDERLLFAIEQGDWGYCITRVELSLLRSGIIEESSLLYYRKTATFLFEHIQKVMDNNGSATRRNNEKVAIIAHLIRASAAPRRSALKIFRRDDVLHFIERILVRAFQREELASRMLTIHAANFHSLRHFRMLRDFPTSGRLLIPLLDAADEEFSWVVSNMPENSKDFICPISSLFSLCVAQIHKISAGDNWKDWLDFLLEDDAVRIIHDIDMKAILALESFARDIKEMMFVLPYYATIDQDILNLMDEVDLDEFVKDASDAIDNPKAMPSFIREKAKVAIERFLNYLPKMSIPVEKRELGDGWVLTCRGEDGGDLTLSNVSILREHLICQVLGGEALFSPVGGEESLSPSTTAIKNVLPTNIAFEEESVLDHIREILLQAQRFGCWREGTGGVSQHPSDRYVASVLRGLPISSVLNCALELWRNLQIDDDELLEITIRDVSYQIQLQKEREEGDNTDSSDDSTTLTRPIPETLPSSRKKRQMDDVSIVSSFESYRRRFNPRQDPTVLYLEMNNLCLNLENFLFRIEKDERKTIFDPVLEGKGKLSIQNISLKLRVECAKERTQRGGLGADQASPVLQLRELDVSLERVTLQVRETGYGSDWLLNRAVSAFSNEITQIVEENLREQIMQQTKNAIDNLNAYFLVNPEMLLNLLGVTMDDLEQNVVWV